MSTQFSPPAGIDYTLGAGESPEDYPTLSAKLERAIEVTATALEAYDRPAVMWTGGKDSTLVLYVVRETARELGVPVPPVVFIDHFEHFAETTDFVDRWVDEWDLDLVVSRNRGIESLPYEPGEEIPLSELGDRNRRELERIDHEGDVFVFDADTLAGNHLLKTVALNETLEEYGFDGIFSGVRWDEQDARADETFFSARHDSEKYPPHDRVHSILQFAEADLWEAFWRYVVPDTVEGYAVGHAPEDAEDLPEDVDVGDLPVSPKYWEGFRSLGTEGGSAASDDVPAWRQDLETTTERDGRAQDKEGVMEQLRDLGYM